MRMGACSVNSILSIIDSATSYLIYSLIDSDFNLTVWKFFVRSPNLNDANKVLHIAATDFHQIKVMPTTIADQFTKHLTCK